MTAWDHYQARRNAIAALLDPRCYSIEWLDQQILDSEALLFTSADAIIVVAVKRYPAGATELHGLVAAGEMEAILPLIGQAEDWARNLGVTFACIASRPGWERVLKTRGYRLYQTDLRKDL